MTAAADNAGPTPPASGPALWHDRLAAVRLLVGAFAVVYLAVRAPGMADFRSFDPARFEPVGPCRLLDGPVPAWLAAALFGVCWLSAIAFALGYRFRGSGPLFAGTLLWVTSYRSSFGMVFHTDNLLALQALVLAATPAAGVHSLDRAAGRARPASAWTARYCLTLIAGVALATYVVAGVAKLKLSGLSWMHGDILRNYIAYDCLRKMQLGSIHSPVGAALVRYAWPFPIIGVATMLVELGAPLALLGPRAAKLWTASALAFHYGVLVVMAIGFPYPLSGIPFAALLPSERLWRLSPVRRLVGSAPSAPSDRGLHPPFAGWRRRAR